MTKPQRWQVSTNAAEVYESYFVPAIFAAWAVRVADAARLKPGDRVLDVGCGTGVLAREALKRVGQKGRVVGLDLNEGMLAVATRVEPKIEWQQGDAASLPFKDASFDAVISQSALMFFADRVAALSHMWRTLAPAGRLTVSVWAPLARARGYQILANLVAEQFCDKAAAVLSAPFVLGDETELTKLLTSSGISGFELTLHEGSARFPSVKDLVHTEIKGSPLAETLNDAALDTLIAKSERALAEFVQPSGEIIVPLDAHFVTASKR